MRYDKIPVRRRLALLPLLLCFLAAGVLALGAGGNTLTVIQDWRLVLVNDEHPLTDFEAPELTVLDNGESVDSRIYPDLQAMFDAARASGVNLQVVEGYRTGTEQQEMMDTYIDRYMSRGYSRAEAEALALEYVAEPGTSEHELGIAVDVGPRGNSTGQSVYSWLARNAWQYGFILRYPQGKEDITGITYEPWHYRYVGLEAAEEIQERQITLEEFLD